MNLSVSKEFHDNLLVPLKGKACNKLEVFGFDIETEHVRKDFLRKSGKSVKCWEQNFVVGSVVGDNTEEVFRDKREMQDYLLGRKFRGSYIFATNLEFDFNMLFRDRLNDFSFIYRHGLLAAIHRKEENKRRRVWTFVDSTNYMKASVANLGKIVGIDKHDKPRVMENNPEGLGIIARRPRNDEEWEELIRYNVQDSRITYLFAEKFKQFCTAHNMKLKLTIGSVGMDYWRRNHQKTPFTREPDLQLRKHFLGSFRGGMTQVFKRGTYEGKVYCYDYRSSYPGVMLKGVDGKGSYPHPSTFVHRDKSNTGLIEEYEGICHAKVKAPYSYVPMLGIKTNDKLLFPYGTFQGWFTNHELRKAMDMGYEVDPGEMIYYHTLFKPFKEAVKTLYKIRKDYKLRKHPFEAMVKTLMNGGLFGKWGTNFMNMEELHVADRLTFDKDGRASMDGKPLDKFSVSNEGVLVSTMKEAKPMRYSFPILSSYTTMLGRVKLIQDITPHKKHLLYSDTDSAYMTRPCIEEKDELGGWELEKVADGALFIRSKLYKLDFNGKPSVCKSKGVGRFMSTDYDFMRAIDTGRIAMERFTKMKESSRMGINSGSIMYLTKDFNLNDDKRDWNGKSFSVDDWQDSEPLKLRDGLTPKDQRKAMEAYQNEQAKQMKKYFRSDLFDRKAVGNDITNEEFLKNEIFFDTM